MLGAFSCAVGAGELCPFGDMKQSVPDIACEQCKKVLAKADVERETYVPAPDALLAAGAVPVPNFGWFCSQQCATLYERAKGRRIFDRNAAGEVQYYPK